MYASVRRGESAVLDESPTTNRDAGTRPAQGAPSVPGRVRQVAVPSTARALTTLSSVEYADAFVLDTTAAHERTPEQWARVILEGAPSVPQRLVLGLLSAIGLQLAPIPSEGSIVGWKIQRSTPEFVLLAASSPRIGLSGELLFQPQQQTLL
jgi:hypothetical protein